ncbi:MAG: peptidylprolyl isomerase [Campylobacterota bacterium]|nr:peptidylprolyl isomerase [Campylobacterota bacterium]
MGKYLFAFLLSCTILNAGLINGIAIIVNDDVITHYDIDKRVQTQGLSKSSAVENLIQESLYSQQLKLYNIDVDIFEIEAYIGKLASINGVSEAQFKEIVKQKNDFTQFQENIKKQLMHQKLIKKIAAGKLNIANEEDIKIYYNNNIEQFNVAETIDVTVYISKSKNSLEQIRLNPMLNDKSVSVENITFKQQEMNPQVRYVINNTQEKTFSSIFTQNNSYNMFFVQAKKEVKELPFSEVKNKIFSQIMKKREESFLKEYFETLKITADIEVLK